MLYVPGLKDNRPSIPALEDAGYDVLFKKGHILITAVGVEQIATVLLRDQRDMEYLVRGQPTSGGSGWITIFGSETDREREAPRIDVATSRQSLVQRGE